MFLPKGSREWSLVGAGAAAAILVLVVLGSRYSVHPEGGAAYRLDRWTGAVSACGGTACYSLKEITAH
jgi:hypothetical protein